MAKTFDSDRHGDLMFVLVVSMVEIETKIWRTAKSFFFMAMYKALPLVTILAIGGDNLFTRMASDEIQIIVRSLLVFILILVVGLATAEYQLNTLTHRYDRVQICNISRDGGGYAAYLFGMQFTAQAVYPVAKLTSVADGIIIAAGQEQVYLPTRIYIKIDTVWYWLNEWYNQFIAEALKTKHDFADYLADARPYLTATAAMIKDACYSFIKYISQFKPSTFLKSLL